tara:strand:+ start:239 stop:1387 length:1149 start_codon:yes stop_codon:yes gene_type:complete
MTFNLKRKLVIYSGAPISYENSIRKYGFHKIPKGKFDVQVVDGSEIFHGKKLINQFTKASKKSDRFNADVKLKNVKDFEDFFANLDKNTLVIVINRGLINSPFHLNNFDLDILNSLNIKYVSNKYLHFNLDCNFKKFSILNFFKIIWNFLIKILDSFKNFKLKPYCYIGSGNLFVQKKLEKKIICTSNYINFEVKKNNKRKYILYVDEGINQSRDTIIYGALFKKVKNEKKFIKDLNNLFSLLEEKYNAPIIIGSSNKYFYKKNPFNGRKIIYAKTSDLIHNAKIVLGHKSSVLYQLLFSNKPALILKHKEFNLVRRILIDLFAINALNQNAFFIEDINKRKFLDFKIDKNFRSKILRKHFISNKMKNKNFSYHFLKEIKEI